MLHLDVWWRGLNVLVDAGSYLYNDRPEWHEHFMRTGCHNTVAIDGRDQMLHFRQFKVLYRTHARLLHFEDNADWAVCAGEHHGYRRHPGNCVHARSVLFLKDDLWVVVDHIVGDGSHAMRLHWLGGDFPYSYDAGASRLTLNTAAGDFFVQVLDASRTIGLRRRRRRAGASAARVVVTLLRRKDRGPVACRRNRTAAPSDVRQCSLRWTDP